VPKELTSSVEVVSIILGKASIVHNVSVGSAVAQPQRCLVGNCVQGRDEINRAALLSLTHSALGAMNGRSGFSGAGESRNNSGGPTNREALRGHLLLDSVGLGVVAWVVAETGGLVHVNPDTVNVDTSISGEEFNKLANPEWASVGMKPIGERSHTRPSEC